MIVMEADIKQSDQNCTRHVENEIKIDPDACLFCHLDKIFPVTGLTKKEIKAHDHDAHITRLPCEYKMIYAYAELFSNLHRMVRDIRDAYSANNVNAFLTQYLPNTSMQVEFSGVQLVKIEKAIRKVISVYTANGMLTEVERGAFFEQMLDTKAIKAKYREGRLAISKEKIDKKWLDPEAKLSKKHYEDEINKTVEDGEEKFTISTFIHELAENIRINIARVVQENVNHGVGHIDDILVSCARLAMFVEAIAKRMIQNSVPLNKFDVLFWGNLSVPENSQILLNSSFFFFPQDTARFVCDLALKHLTRSCARCDFKCLRSNPSD
jgi:hypothetical protein